MNYQFKRLFTNGTNIWKFVTDNIKFISFAGSFGAACLGLIHYDIVKNFSTVAQKLDKAEERTTKVS